MFQNYFLGTPELRLSEDEKYKEEKAWFKKVMDYHVPIGSISQLVTNAYLEMKDNYDYLNNNFNYEEWKSICDELNIEEDTFSKKMQMVNVIPKIFNYLKTVELKRIEEYTPVLLTQQSLYKKDEEYKNYINEYVDAQINIILTSSQKYADMQAKLMVNGNLTDVQMQKIQQEVEAEIQKMKADLEQRYPKPQTQGFLSEMEILANKILQYLRTQNLKKIKNDCFDDVILNDREFIKLDTTFEGVKITRINPLFFKYHKSNDTEYVHQGIWASHTVQMSPYELKLYFPRITNDEWAMVGLTSHNMENPSDKINTKHHDMYPEWDIQMLSSNALEVDKYASYGRGELPYFNRERLIPVTHIEWKAFKKIGVLTTADGMGGYDKIFVDETFKVPKKAKKENYTNEYGFENDIWYFEDSTLEWFWIPRVYEGTRIGFNYYTDMREKPYQPINSDNIFECHLSYYGKVYSQYNSKSISIFERMKPYNVLYMVLFNKLIKLIGKWDGYLIPIDTSAIDINLGKGDPESALNEFFRLRKEGYYVYNSLKDSEGDDAKMSRPAPAVMPADVGQTFVNLMNLMNWVNSEMAMIVGISPQALAQMTYSNVSDNQQALSQTSYMIDPLFQAHNYTWSHIVQGYLNTFVEWAKDKMEQSTTDEYILNFIFDEQMKQTLRLKGDLTFAEYGVFLTNGNHKEYYDVMMQLSHAYVQTQQISLTEMSSLLLSIERGDSPYEVHKKFMESEKKKADREQQAQEMQNKLEEKKLQMQEHLEEFQKEIINLKEQWQQQHIELQESLKGQYDLEKQAMSVYAFQEDLDANKDGVPDPLKASQLQHKMNIDNQKLEMDKIRLANEVRSQRFEEIKEKNKPAKKD